MAVKAGALKRTNRQFRLLRLFFGVEGGRQWVVLSWLIASAFMGGLGLATLAPIISVLSSSKTEDTNHITSLIFGALETIGLNPSLGALVMIMIIGVNLQAILLWLGLRRVGYAVADVVFNYRTKILNSLIASNWAYFSRLPTGRLTSALTGETQACGAAYGTVANMLAQAIKGVVYVSLALLISWPLALASILLGSLIALILSRQVRKSRRAGERRFKAFRELSVSSTQALGFIKPLKAMNRQSAYAERIIENISRIRKTSKKEVRSQQTLSSFQGPLLFTSIGAGCYFLIGILGMAVSEVLITGFLIERSVKVTNNIQKMWQKVAASEYAFTLIVDLLDEARREVEDVGGEFTPSLKYGCEYRNVSFYHGKSLVIDQLNLYIPANKITLIMGPSGAGKTTISDLLLGFYRPNSGEVFVDDVPMAEIDIRSWRKSIGYVPQDLLLFNASVLENVILGDKFLTREMAEEALRDAGAWRFVSSLPLGIDTSVGEKGVALSGGQRQRIAIARALVHQPKLLILDEATSALDGEAEEEICRSIRGLTERLTVLTISHRHSWEKVADTVFYLDGQNQNSLSLNSGSLRRGV